eukprot:GCRY01001789.1.p1 GENE.GCRY01001789.1~~GCRY01001789.1.p1  ORF type:complete len:137 (+),score=5.96 GCRY01001789.1:169-579(+)
MIYEFIIYDKWGSCVYEENFYETSSQRNEGRHKLIYGLLFSLEMFCKKIAPFCEPSFRSYSTSTYKLHALTLPTGIKLAMLTDSAHSNLQDRLKHIYRNIYAEIIPRESLDYFSQGQKITNQHFIEEVRKYIQQIK